MKFAIFLGAGASASEGAPIQSNLFRDYFKLIKSRNKNPQPEHEKELINFFSSMFDIDFVNGDLDKTIFPTFEEALGILDLADLKSEAFRNFSNINLESKSGKIKFLRLYLVFLMADIIHEALNTSAGIHRTLIQNLNSLNQIDNAIFVTTNYDILCDNAISELFELGRKMDYGVDFVNYDEGDFPRPDMNSIKLFKLHGSLNWLYCPTCNNLRLTPNIKGVYDLMTAPADQANTDPTDQTKLNCKNCGTFYSPIIVPPTFYKDLSKVFLNEVWHKAEMELLKVEHIIFCGYSFPDADIHIKYLLKRVQKNKRITGGFPVDLKFTVINSYPDKTKEMKDEEKYRFKRFLGANVNYTKLSFEKFANDPGSIIS